MARTPEAAVKDAVKKYLKERGAWYFMPVSNGMGQSGIPDLICCYRGYFIGIETKAPGKRNQTTANQDRVIRQINEAAGAAWVVDDPAQLDELFTTVDVLRKLGVEK
jgi:hypothetical protein